MPDSALTSDAHVQPRAATILLVLATASVAAIGAGVAAGAPPLAPSPLYWPYLAQYFLAGALCLTTARLERAGRDRQVWWLLASATMSTGVAVLVGGLFRPSRGSPLLVALDFAALVFYPLVSGALILLGPVRERARARDALDFVVVSVATITLGAHFWIATVARNPVVTAPTVVYGVLLPVGTLLSLFAALGLVLRYGGRRPRRSDALVIAGSLLCVASDVVTSLQPRLAADLRLGWAAGTLLIGLAAWFRARDLLQFGVRLHVPPVRPAQSDDTPRPPERPSGLAYGAIGAVGLALAVEVLPALTDATRVLLVGGIVLGMVLVVREVTTSRAHGALARARAEEEARFRALVQRSSDALLIVAPDGGVKYHTPSLPAIVGVPVAAPRALAELLHPDDAPAAADLLARLGQAAGRTGSLTVRGAGSGRTLELSAINRLDDPAIGGLVLSVRDTTERRRLELQLQQAQKMDGLGRLAGGIAHDFNNLLTAIIGYAQLAQWRAEEMNEDASPMHEIVRAGRQATELTRQLLAFSRRQPLTPGVVSLDAAVDEMRLMIGRLLPEDIEVHVVQGTSVPPVLADPTQLQQVVLNLAVNARDAMADGGVLVLATERFEPDAAYLRAHPGTSAGPHAVLQVSDTGVGMSPDVLARVFEPFFTTKPEGAGTGLGLATVYGIVRQAGGHVTVESRPRRGTTFRIVLPAAPNGAVAQPADTVSTESMSPAAPGAAGNALLVEDNDAVRALAADALRAYGFDVTAVGSGAEALDLGDAGLHPQLLVTDVVMPGIGGIELARALRERFPDLPVLFATAHSERDPVHALAGSAPTALLPKPFTADELGSRSRVLVADARRRAVA